jgi:hypothetical protein
MMEMVAMRIMVMIYHTATVHSRWITLPHIQSKRKSKTIRWKGRDSHFGTRFILQHPFEAEGTGGKEE